MRIAIQSHLSPTGHLAGPGRLWGRFGSARRLVSLSGRLTDSPYFAYCLLTLFIVFDRLVNQVCVALQYGETHLVVDWPV